MNTSERPLITFLLISYNQEKYIKEAIDGVFAQTYEPLEIILSDDCSTDRTFEIIQRTAERYEGPHRVIARQTPKNIGTFAHVMDVVNDVRGELVVLGAGDDISKPERVTKLAAAWQLTGAWGLHSRFDRIDADGNLLGVAQLSEGLLRPEYRLRQYFYKEDGPVDIVHGVGSAYDVRIFKYLTEYSERFILSEDGVVSFLLNLLKKRIYLIDESLVFYREHLGSLTNSGNKVKSLSVNDVKGSEKKNITYSKSLANRTRMFLELADSINDAEIRHINRQEIMHDNNVCRFKANWMQSSFIDRIKFLLYNRQRSDLKWIIPRILGYKCFVISKYLLKH